MFLVDTARGPDRLRRRAEGRGLAAARSRTRMEPRRSSSASTTSRARRASSSPTTRPSSGARRSSATPPRTSAIFINPMATTGADPDRLHGQRRPARRPLRPPAAPLQLLQAALRAGHEPAGGRHPRGDRHGGGDLDRPGGQPARAGAGRRPPAGAPVAGPLERGAGEDPPPPRRARRRAASATITLPILFRVGGRTARGSRRAIEDVRRRASEAIAEGHNLIILSDRGHDETRRADPGAPRRLGGPPPPRPRRHPHAGRPRPRVRRAARGPPLLPPHRLRRERGQPVPRVRDDRRPGAPGRHRRPDRRPPRRATARRS